MVVKSFDIWFDGPGWSIGQLERGLDVGTESRENERGTELQVIFILDIKPPPVSHIHLFSLSISIIDIFTSLSVFRWSSLNTVIDNWQHACLVDTQSPWSNPLSFSSSRQLEESSPIQVAARQTNAFEVSPLVSLIAPACKRSQRNVVRRKSSFHH